MIKAYKAFWAGYFDFTGRCSRSDYWWVVLSHVLMALVALGSLAVLEFTPTISDNLSVTLVMISGLCLIYYFATLIPNISITVRRLRDAGFHWVFIFLNAVPFGSLVLIVLLAQKSLPTQTEQDEQDHDNLNQETPYS